MVIRKAADKDSSEEIKFVKPLISIKKAPKSFAVMIKLIGALFF